jgi:Na+-driven multidrug efflux pump
MFRGIGMGTRSLIVTILRTIILQVPIAYLFSIVFGLGLTGVWIGLVLGNVLAVIVTFAWGRVTIARAL